MNVASLDLCKELYELSGWEMTWFRWYEDADGNRELSDGTNMGGMDYTNAYDLGYLLRKLPKPAGISQMLSSDEVWIATSGGFHPNKHPYLGAETPEDAACKLAIELFKQGVLK